MGAKRAGVVGVDIEPNVSQIGSKVEAAARLLKPLGLRVNLDNDFTREIEAGVARLLAPNGMGSRFPSTA